MLLGMLNLSGTNTVYPVIVQTKKFRHDLWIDTPIGRKLFGSARHVEHRRSLCLYSKTNFRVCARDRCSGKGQLDMWRLLRVKKFSLSRSFCSLSSEHDSLTEEKGEHA